MVAQPPQNRNANDLKPHVRDKFLKAVQECKKIGCDVRMSEGFRTRERQDRLLGQGRTARDLENNRGVDGKYADPGKSKVTRVKTSKHQLGCAVDIFFNIPGDIYRNEKREPVSKIFMACGFKRGFDMRGTDKPHFEDNGEEIVFEKETLSAKEKGYLQIVIKELGYLYDHYDYGTIREKAHDLAEEMRRVS